MLSEAEFQSYRTAMEIDPPPELKLLHLAKLGVSVLASLAGSWGGKWRPKPEHLDPWEHALTKRENEAAASERIELWAMSAFGAPG